MLTATTALRRPSLCLASLLASVICGCGARAATPSPTPTAASTQAAPITAATAAATLTPALQPDPCAWLLPSDAPPLLGHAVVTSIGGVSTETGVANGLPECSYSTASLEEMVPPPPAIETDARVSILNSSAFAQAQNPVQPDTASYTILPVSASSIIPGASSSDATFFAVSVATAAQLHFSWTYLYVRVDSNVYFRVGVADPSGSQAQRRAKAVTAALDVLRNLKLSS
jgi:hypothetical protein